MPESGENLLTRCYGIASGAYVLVVSAVSHQCSESLDGMVGGNGIELGVYRVDGVVIVDVHILHGFGGGERREEVIIKYAGNKQQTYA